MRHPYTWLIVVVLAVAGIMLILRAGGPPQVACTMEAKLCPDGSYVARTGPKCEFAACPVSSSTTAIISESGNMKVFSPKANEQVARPLVIVGEGRTFENVFNFRLLDNNGKVISEGRGMLNAPDSGEFGSFNVMLDYPASGMEREAILEVFEYSAKDGSVVNNVRIPIILAVLQP